MRIKFTHTHTHIHTHAAESPDNSFIWNCKNSIISSRRLFVFPSVDSNRAKLIHSKLKYVQQLTFHLPSPHPAVWHFTKESSHCIKWKRPGVRANVFKEQFDSKHFKLIAFPHSRHRGFGISLYELCPNQEKNFVAKWNLVGIFLSAVWVHCVTMAYLV